MTHRELPGVHQRCTLKHMREPPERLSGDVRRPLQPRGHPGRVALATALPSTTWSRYPDIITAAEPGGTPYYTNSSHLPVGYTEDIFAALDIQDELQTLYTSGTVFHAFLGEKLPDWQAAATLVRKIAENYKLPYYTLSPTYSVCKNARLPRRRAVHLPALRRERRGLQPHHRLLPPGPELERRQDPGVQGAQDLRPEPQPPRPASSTRPSRAAVCGRRSRTWTGTSAPSRRRRAEPPRASDERSPLSSRRAGPALHHAHLPELPPRGDHARQAELPL